MWSSILKLFWCAMDNIILMGGEYWHFYYRPEGNDNFMGCGLDGYTIGVACKPNEFDADAMKEIILDCIKTIDESCKIADFKYAGTYPFNDAYGRISSDIWVANIETIYV